MGAYDTYGIFHRGIYDVDRCRVINALIEFGRGVAKDERLAFVYYEKAAQQGSPGAQFNTGVYYRDGRGCEQSYERSAEWFEKAALQGDADAQQSLGRAYDLGLGILQSYESESISMNKI